ncbi:ornithine decarboxylase [Pseudoponticoccus marisrubri]|uniref:ornithine decarboxylase n=1 Tax=Pseudoponticoccus marisrubri TaxID=1685382 RepID=A0A0W7WNI1_9RHOB|nr:ornithine decarboxylase [Pseudoponticoccus marisrubri]KUF12071.1 ornithine decarboxylase [Pseudoponticoccus marisrubri]
MPFDSSFSDDPVAWLARMRPDEPVYFFSPARLRATAEAFLQGFPGQVTYAVKANPDPLVLDTLIGAGLDGFDVASPAEMALVQGRAPRARLNYHNPVRSAAEIAEARRRGVASWSVDRMGELDKLGDITGCEIAVRLALPVKGAVYDFGSKFGAPPELTVALLRAVAARGGFPAITFHPGTQCEDPAAWASYIAAAAGLAGQAGVTLVSLNVGGGFPAHRHGTAPDLSRIFDTIRAAARAAFDPVPPLVCEPGRGLVAEAFTLALRVRAAGDGAVFLNDGIYGGLSEWRDLGPASRITVLAPDGQARGGPVQPMTVFGPTCDSLDRLSDRVALPASLAEGDYLLFAASGAYAAALSTSFNGYGARRIVTVLR